MVICKTSGLYGEIKILTAASPSTSRHGVYSSTPSECDINRFPLYILASGSQPGSVHTNRHHQDLKGMKASWILRVSNLGPCVWTFELIGY